MRIGAFEVQGPLPELKAPYVFANLRPWVDVNKVGTLVLKELETQFEAKGLAKFAKPGHFFDFTRYRPTLYLEQGVRRVSIPNVRLRYAKREENDFLFLHLLEPHAFSEAYIDSVLKIFKTFKVKKYIVLGSMYDMVPHTRPLILHGGGVGREAERDLKKAGVSPSRYQGPTSITTLISHQAPEFGVETVRFTVSLPQYVVVEEDYMGKVRLMETLNLLYNIPMNEDDLEKAREQRGLISQKVERSPELKQILPQLESMYDVRVKSGGRGETPEISTDIEEMLLTIKDKDFGKA